MLRSLKYSDYPDLNIVYCNVGEYGGSEIFSVNEVGRIEENFKRKTIDNFGEIIVKRIIKNKFYHVKTTIKEYDHRFRVFSTE